VTLVEMLDHLAGDLSPEASRAIGRSLKKRGVDVRLGARIVSAQNTHGGVVVEIEDGASVQAECILACVGRAPNVEAIGLEQVGVRLQNGVIAVDEHCLTNVAGIYAVGDVAERRQYAHLASRMGLVAADNATGHKAFDDRSVVPVGVYTHPQVACVGLSRQRAADLHGQVRAARFPLGANGLSNVHGEVEGFAELIATEADGRILGAVLVAPGATELIQEIALAMREDLTIEDVARTIHPHPTLVETLGEAAESWLGLPLHSLR
jgi:dihydrolipoyl dehydrogenase